VDIRNDVTPEELWTCALMMSTTDPWVTMGRAVELCHAGIAHEDARILLACENGQVLGFLAYNMRVGIIRGYIQNLCVFEGARGKGVGTFLMSEAEKRILEECPNVFICVSSFNKRAKSLYERLGYQVVGEFEDMVIRGHSEFLLRKTTGPLSEFRP